MSPYISIHAPARGATVNVPDTCCLNVISIHAPARGATVFQPPHPALVQISIHAPARGATDCASSSRCPCHYFNPRSREGSDVKLVRVTKTHKNFNPRSREGSDYFIKETDKTYKISIHAPARGATLVIRICRQVSIYFNPRSREGSDCSSMDC